MHTSFSFLRVNETLSICLFVAGLFKLDLNTVFCLYMVTLLRKISDI